MPNPLLSSAHINAFVAGLPPKLRAAVRRLDPECEPPIYGRFVQIGIDYSLRVADWRECPDSYAEALADMAYQQMLLRPGDPPATGEAQQRAERAGPEHGQAFVLLNQLRDCQDTLRDHGEEVPDMPDEAWSILQTAACGQPVDMTVLQAVLRQGHLIASELAMRVLQLPCDAPA